FAFFQVRDIKTDPVQGVRLAVLAAQNFDLTLKPNYLAVARDHAVNSIQVCPEHKQFGGFVTPSLLVVGMDVRIPAQWVFQPLALRESQSCFNLRTDVGVAYAPLQ